MRRLPSQQCIALYVKCISTARAANQYIGGNRAAFDADLGASCCMYSCQVTQRGGGSGRVEYSAKVADCRYGDIYRLTLASLVKWEYGVRPKT